MSDLNVSDVLSEAVDLYQEVSEVRSQNENIEAGLETAEEIGTSLETVKTEGLSPSSTRILNLTAKRILGVDVLPQFSIKMEDGANDIQTSLVLESVKQMIKDFWQALKNSFNAIWSKLKSWYIAISSASESLVKKANKLKTRADQMSGSPTERNFEFRGFGSIAINNKLNSIVLRNGIKTIQSVLDQSLNVKTTKEVESFIEAAEDSIDSFVKNSTTSTPDTSWAARFSDIYKPKVGVKTTEVNDKDIQEQVNYDPENADYQMTEALPGNKAIVFSSVKEASTAPFWQKTALIFAKIVSMTKRELPESVNAEVLHPATISDICDSVIQFNEQITFYEKAWDRRDKFMSKMLSSLDKSISNINDDDDVQEGHDKIYKKTTRAILSAIKRSNTYNASLINYVVKVSAASLTYCEASLNMNK